MDNALKLDLMLGWWFPNKDRLGVITFLEGFIDGSPILVVKKPLVEQISFFKKMFTFLEPFSTG